MVADLGYNWDTMAIFCSGSKVFWAEEVFMFFHVFSMIMKTGFSLSVYGLDRDISGFGGKKRGRKSRIFGTNGEVFSGWFRFCRATKQELGNSRIPPRFWSWGKEINMTFFFKHLEPSSDGQPGMGTAVCHMGRAGHESRGTCTEGSQGKQPVGDHEHG